eukprot:354720-Chlamydomonas_euryale.AAC.1
MDVRNVRALAAFRQFQGIWAGPKLSNEQNMDVYRTFVLPTFLYGCKTWTWTEVQMGKLQGTHSNCLCRIVGVKLMDRHRLETTICEQMWHVIAGVMVCRRTLQWMGHVLRMDERLPRQVFDCSLVAEDGRMEQLKSRPGHRNITDFSGMYSSAVREKVPVVAPLLGLPQVAWPHLIDPLARDTSSDGGACLDRQAWQDAIKKLAPFEFKKPQQVGRMTRSCARRGRSG